MTLRDIVEAHVACFNNHDAAGWGSRYAEDAVLYDPQYPEPLRGRAAIQKDAEDFLAAFPDIRFSLGTVVSGEGVVALEGTATGTHGGPMAGPGGTVPPTGKVATMPFATFVRFDGDGCIAEERRYYDIAGMLQQLGLLPAGSA